MTSVTQATLIQRLVRVEALERGATTPGEREAASRARERLTARLIQVRERDPVARFVADHVAALGVAPQRRPAPRERLPTPAALAAALARWRAGEWSRLDIHVWAEHIVDRVVLPTDPRAEGACISEVLLQLSMMHRVALTPADIPEILSFVRGEDWSAWFALIAAATKRPRP